MAWVGDRPRKQAIPGLPDRNLRAGGKLFRSYRRCRLREKRVGGRRSVWFGTRPVTHLEIGKIEVEIVPPAGTQRAPVAPARPTAQGLRWLCETRVRMEATIAVPLTDIARVTTAIYS